MDEFGKLMLMRREFLGGNRPLWLRSEEEKVRKTKVDINVKKTEDAIQLEFSIPGFKKEEIKIEFHNNILRIEAKKEKSEKNDYQHFEREELIREAISIDDRKILADCIDATLENGILRVTLPINKKEEARRIIKIA